MQPADRVTPPASQPDTPQEPAPWKRQPNSATPDRRTHSCEPAARFSAASSGRHPPRGSGNSPPPRTVRTTLLFDTSCTFRHAQLRLMTRCGRERFCAECSVSLQLAQHRRRRCIAPKTLRQKDCFGSGTLERNRRCSQRRSDPVRRRKHAQHMVWVNLPSAGICAECLRQTDRGGSYQLLSAWCGQPNRSLPREQSRRSQIRRNP